MARVEQGATAAAERLRGAFEDATTEAEYKKRVPPAAFPLDLLPSVKGRSVTLLDQSELWRRAGPPLVVGLHRCHLPPPTKFHLPSFQAY